MVVGIEPKPLVMLGHHHQTLSHAIADSVECLLIPTVLPEEHFLRPLLDDRFTPRGDYHAGLHSAGLATPFVVRVERDAHPAIGVGRAGQHLQQFNS